MMIQIKSHDTRILQIAAFLFCLALGVQPVVAQDEPAEEAEQSTKPIQLFSLDRIDAYVELESSYDHRRVQYERRTFQRTSQIQTNRDWSLEERIGFQLSGSIIDPSVIAFDGEISFALTQDHYDEKNWYHEISDSDWGHLLTYDIFVNLFQGKPLSGSVYARRVDDRISRRFLPTLNEQRTGFGTSWYWADPKLPMELTYDYLETDRTGNRDGRDDEHYTDSTLHYGLQWLITDHHRFKLSYDHSDMKQEYQGLAPDFETRRDLFTLEHELEFGSHHQHELRSLIHWQEESGDFARDFFNFRPELRLRHTDDFQTIYRYDYLSEKYEQFDIDQHRIEFQFIHQLYTNLTTTGHAFGLYEKIEDDIETYQYGAGLDFQYNRKNPLGHFYSNLAVAFDNEHTRGDNGRRVVVNESASFHDPIAITLRHQNVNPFSVRVTDASNRRVYLPGYDYFVVRQGTWTRIARNPAGQIADRDTVLIDYEYATPADGEVDTIRIDFGLEQRFANGLTPYYYFDYRHQEIDNSYGFRVEADRTNHHRFGLKYEQERWSAGAEFEIFDDAVEPYHAFHLDGRLSGIRDHKQNLDFAARFSQFYFEGGFDDRQVTFLDLEVDHRVYLGSNTSWNNRAAYRWENDSVAGETNGVDVATGVSYTWGDLAVELTVEYDMLDLPYSDEDGLSVWLNIRREIPGLYVRKQ